ncbi:MAG: CHAT domain-containing protein, partial [Microcoleaceae cyanobacterium]
QSLNNLALLYKSQGRLSEAFNLMHQAIQVENHLIRRTFAYSSDRERINYLQTIEHNYHLFLSLVCNHLSDSPAAVQTALDVVLQRKCLTASALAAFNSAMYRDRYSHLKEKFDRFRSLKEQIIHLTFNPPLPKPEETEEELQSRKTTHQKQLSDLKTECERLEKELAKQVPEMQLQEQITDRNAVALELPTGSALVEFVRFNVFDFPTRKWQPAQYIAFILPSQQPDAVEMIKLGDAEHIDNLIRIYRETITSINPLGDLGLLPKKTPKNQPKSYIVEGINLRQKIYDPLLQSRFFQNQENLKHLYIAPDDSLNLIAWENLPLDETDNQLIRDRYTISYFSVGRDILRRKIPSKPPASPALIIAHPNFDLGKPETTTINPPESQPLTVQTSSPQILNSMTANQVISTLAGTSFAPLQDTQFLGEIAAKSLGVDPYFQDEAVELKLTKGKCPRILLIATHGHFVESKTPDNSNINRISSPEIKDPMMRSLLAFSGANNWLSGGEPHPKAGKGILFAQEVANLDLWGNELTILVACQTALGDTKAGEGVFGLRRAFPAAGSKTLIISLWSVPTKASMLLMERFLDNLKQPNVGRGDALIAAQNYLRTVTIKELQKSDLGNNVIKELVDTRNLSDEEIKNQPDYQPLKHPYYWGAWVCQGDIDDM